MHSGRLVQESILTIFEEFGDEFVDIVHENFHRFQMISSSDVQIGHQVTRIISETEVNHERIKRTKRLTYFVSLFPFPHKLLQGLGIHTYRSRDKFTQNNLSIYYLSINNFF